jgi:tetratricopeptide (TPR) repeat protein
VIQDEIAASVVKALKVSLLGDAPRVAETSPDAYSLFLESVYFYYKGESLRAEALIDRALEIDNQFAAGWAQLSWVRLVGTTNGLRPPIEGAALARAAAAEALRLDANNGTAHLTLSTIAGRYDYDMKTAKTELDLALQQIPGDSDALRIAAEWSIMAGDFEEAIRIAQEAELLDPRYVRNKVGIGMPNFMARRFNDAKSAFGDAIALDSERLGVHYRMGAAMVVTGDYEGALEEFNRESRDGFVLTGRALAFHAMGDSARADEEFAKLIELGITWTYEIAKVHAYRGDLDDAFAWLDRAMDRRDQSLTYILGDPFMDNLRNDPRYDAVLERLGRKAP